MSSSKDDGGNKKGGNSLRDLQKSHLEKLMANPVSCLVPTLVVACLVPTLVVACLVPTLVVASLIAC